MNSLRRIGANHYQIKPVMKSETAYPGIAALLFLAALILLLMFCAGCAEYPLTLSVRSDHGSLQYSAKGIEVIIEK